MNDERNDVLDRWGVMSEEEQVEGLLRADAENARLREDLANMRHHANETLRAETTRLRASNAELRAALEWVIEVSDIDHGEGNSYARMARAALASAEGKTP